MILFLIVQLLFQLIDHIFNQGYLPQYAHGWIFQILLTHFVQVLAEQLNQAHEGMFVWMRQYSLDEEGKTPEELKTYLDEQLVKVNQVNADIKAALEQAALKLKD